MNEESTTQSTPNLAQGCMISAGVMALTVGGCLVAGLLESDLLFNLSSAVVVVAGVVGLVLLIAHFDAWLKRE